MNHLRSLIPEARSVSGRDHTREAPGTRGRLRGAAILMVALAAGLAATASAGPPLPPLPGDERELESDWVQLKSGEWLKGEFMHMQDEKLLFDSDEFDDQQLDWGDVARVVSANPHTFRLVRRKTVIKGTFEMRDGVVFINDGTRILELQPDEVLSVLPGEGTELDWWSLNASLSYSGRSGNTRQSDLTTRIELMRRTPATRFQSKYLGSISSLDGVETASSNRVPSNFDYFITNKFFVQILSFEYFNDQFQNLDRRFTVGAGLGYQVYADSMVTWELTANGAYQNTKFIEVTGADPGGHDAALVLGTKVDLDLWKGTEWDNSYKIQLVPTDMDKTSHHAESVLSFDIWGPLDLDVALIFDRIEGPVADDSGMVPLKNDFKVTVGVALDL